MGSEDGFYYTVKSGDTLSNIANRFGVASWKTIYNHGKNVDFRAKRSNPNIIYPDDRVWVPGATPNKVPAKSGKKYIIKVKTLPPNPLQKILNDYQVDDDRVEKWGPKLSGVIPIPFTENREMTVTEGKLLDNLSFDRGLLGLQKFKDIRDKAFNVADSTFPHNGVFPAYVSSQQMWVNNDGHRDAFRHAYWSALLTAEFGANWTTQFTTAHEAIPGNFAAREAMDLYNNEVGQSIAIANPKADENVLANLIKDAVIKGKLVIIDQSGKLVWSNSLPLWQHGIASTTTLPGVILVPDGTATVKVMKLQNGG